jgi:hypothetical protein
VTVSFTIGFLLGVEICAAMRALHVVHQRSRFSSLIGRRAVMLNRPS